MEWKEAFFEALFPIDERVISVPYALKRRSMREWLDRIIPDRKKTNYDLALKLLEENMPTSVYKYRAVSKYSLDNFEHDTIWLTHPEDFNDPFDSIIIEREVNYRDTLIARYITKEEVDRVEEIFRRGYVERTQSTFTVASLSENNSSVLMWSHYSNDHKGFCIEYNAREIFYSNEVDKHFFPVRYIAPEEQQLPISCLALDYAGLYSVLCKTKDWDYEKEWRICFGIECDQTPRNFQLPKATGVYVGAKIPKDDYWLITECARYKNIPIYQEVLDLQNRQIKFELVAY